MSLNSSLLNNFLILCEDDREYFCAIGPRSLQTPSSDVFVV